MSIENYAGQVYFIPLSKNEQMAAGDGNLSAAMDIFKALFEMAPSIKNDGEDPFLFGFSGEVLLIP